PLRTTSDSAAIAIERDAILADGHVIGRTGDVRDGDVVPTADGGGVVRLERRGVLRGPLLFALPKLEDARALLRLVGADVSRHTSSFVIEARSLAHEKTKYAIRLATALTVVLVPVVVALLANAISPVVSLAGFAAVLGAGIASLVMPVRVTVG